MPSPVRALIVEDQPAGARRMVEELRHAGLLLEWRRVETEADYLAELEAGADVILATQTATRFGAVRALHLLHRRGLAIPVIAIVKTAGDEGPVECLKRCASGYVPADRLALLAPAVICLLEPKRAQGAKRPVSQGAQAVQALEPRSKRGRSLVSEVTLAEQREGRRLGEAVHDGLRLLLAAHLRGADLEQHPDPRIRDTAAGIVGLLEEALKRYRSLADELSPPILYTAGLLPALHWLARWMAQSHQLTVEVHEEVSGLAPIDERTRLLLFHSIRELLLNAAKYAQVPRVQVEVTLHDHALQIRVVDSGVGFDPAASSKDGEAAGGCGLCSIRQQLESLGGRLEIESSPGRGSRFLLVVPLDQAQAAAQPRAGNLPRPEQRTAVAGAAPPRGRPIRVLVVDDHAVVRQGLTRLLMAESDIDVVGEAADGKAAVDLAGQLMPDVVTMDINMPVMNGIEAMRRIRGAHPTVRMIGLSMFQDEEQAAVMRDAGAAAYLTKTGPVDLLIAAIRADRNPGSPGRA